MHNRFASIALVLIAALSGCCHPCCAPRPMCQPGVCQPAVCPPESCGQGCQHAGCRGGVGCRLHGALHHHWNYWKQPPRPAPITPPVPHFHPVPARPVFEIPPADYSAVPTGPTFAH
ncbi:hypothetical protein [Anatilimnocola aggregata]|uniref:hypothetical protein n=1 Tax=Anatilimnocola aggregata TaxID=2528021 RepID=UPI00119CBD4B|nr:hypothetical protein [Anatilimnocola aggregata]